jgi:flagellar protein FliL
MTDAVDAPNAEPKKTSKVPFVIGLCLALAGAAAGFFATKSGLIPGLSASHEAGSAVSADAEADSAYAAIGAPVDVREIEFVELDPIMISLNGPGSVQNLRFRAHVEVNRAHKNAVEKLKPRIVDVLNSYLRALDVEDLTGPAALLRLRAHMLRRIKIVAGDDAVRDLLIMEFILN